MAHKGGDRAIITFREVDEVNHPTAAIIFSEPTTEYGSDEKAKGKSFVGRVDIAHAASRVSRLWSSKPLMDLLIDVFLPSGYPHSVTDDYIPYQIFDSLQAFSSSIAGLLSSRAVLQGVGVGNADASPTSALLLHILQDSSGRIATIFFAHRVGTALEPECKMYRLAADVFNDLAMILDCLSPIIPGGVSRVVILSTAGMMRALCGVSGGSSKASLSAHFSRWGNLAEVNAKDSSQETVISLIGMLVGSFVVSHVTSYTATWLCLLTLLTIHLSLNYAAVRSVQMTTLNRQRANIVFSALLDSDPDLDTHSLSSPREETQHQQQHSNTNRSPRQALSLAQVAAQERIFETTGTLKWHAQILGTCQIGISFQQFLLSFPSQISSTSTINSLNTLIPLSRLSALFAAEDYLLFIARSRSRSHSPSPRKWHASIVLKRGCNSKSQLKAWMHALLTARALSVSTCAVARTEVAPSEEVDSTMGVLSRTLEFLNCRSRFDSYVEALADVGWDMSVAALETKPGRRIEVGS